MSVIVIQVAPARQEGSTARWFVSSATSPGVYWLVTLRPGPEMTCTCPRGRTLVAKTHMTCRHQRAVLEVEQERVA